MKATLTAHIKIDVSAWERVQDLALKDGRPLPEVLGDLLQRASEEPGSETPKAEPYELPPLTRLWVQRHPDTIIERD